MSKQIKLALDLDGVLFDFNQSFVQLARTIYPDLQCPAPSATWPTKWDYLDDYLETKQIDHLWGIICRKDGFFWANLPIYGWSSDLLREALKADKLYYITSRVGPRVQQQTEQALVLLAKQFGRTFTGAVIPVDKPEDKLPVINALKCTHFLDDKPETVQLAQATCTATSTALWHQPWNQLHHLYPRLGNVDDFRQWLGVV